MSSPSPRPALRIGAVARSTGLSPDTIRHYERIGIIVARGRTGGGFRLFAPEELRRVQVAQAALLAGFTLGELSSIFAERRSGRAPCRRVRELAEKKLHRIDSELARLTALRRALQRTLADWDSRLMRAAPGQAVGLLEALADSMARSGPRLPSASRGSLLRPLPPRRRRAAP